MLKFFKQSIIIGTLLSIVGVFNPNPLSAQEVPTPKPQEKWTPDWVGKPIQCVPLDQIAIIAKRKGLQIIWSGAGIGDSNNLGQLPVNIFLSINPKTTEWVLTEIVVNRDRGCILGYGAGWVIDKETMKLLAEPKI